ncbi:cell envelope integrity protein TolA [Litoreibacter albidus]|uniref:cell envelope integrity protein TolA n=1 Tax=Litoreibacter albidus TaxID=670155 RepID=UPI00373697E7
MIATSRTIKIAAVMLAAGAHLGVSGALAPDTKVEIESSAGAAEARLGANFADMSAGTLTPAKVETVTEAVQPKPIVTAPQPVTAPAPKATPAPDPTALAVLSPVAAAPLPPTKPLEVIKAAPEDAAATSPRPKRRDTDLAPRKPVKVAKAAPARKKAPKAKRDTGKVSNRQGAATGTETARAASQGTQKGRAAKSGNAAASNYPGKVMHRISRIRKPNVSTRGVAVVSFAIASSGQLSSLSIARSSGSAALDKAALGVIRKAQPFPAPPHGARRSFSIKIKGS